MYVRKQQIEAKRGTKQGCSPKEHMPRVERVCHEPLQKQWMASIGLTGTMFACIMNSYSTA